MIYNPVLSFPNRSNRFGTKNTDYNPVQTLVHGQGPHLARSKQLVPDLINTEFLVPQKTDLQNINRYQLSSFPSPRSNPKHPTSGSPPSQDEGKVHLCPIIKRRSGVLDICHVCTKTGSRVIHQNQMALGEAAKQWLQFAMENRDRILS